MVKAVTVMVSPWAQEELASVDLGDGRLDARAAVLLSALGNRPNLSIPAACGGRAEMQAAYRFFDNGKVSFEKVLAPHADRTLQRRAGQPVVLRVQDTTEIDLARPQQQVGGAGKLDGGSRRGVLLHGRQRGGHLRVAGRAPLAAGGRPGGGLADPGLPGPCP